MIRLSRKNGAKIWEKLSGKYRPLKSEFAHHSLLRLLPVNVCATEEINLTEGQRTSFYLLQVAVLASF
jgi:hypothetical protein